MAFVLLSAVGASGGERAELDWKDLRPDDKVSGQTLCALSLYMMLQEVERFCKFVPSPADEAVNRAVTAIQAFMIANSSYRPTLGTFEGMRRTIAENVSKADSKYTCDYHGFAEFFQTQKPDTIDAGIATLLATPPKPGENVPCL